VYNFKPRSKPQPNLKFELHSQHVRMLYVQVAARATITQAEEAGWDDEEPASPTSAAGMGAAGSSAPVQPTIVGGQDPHKQQGEEGQPTETPTATGKKPSLSTCRALTMAAVHEFI
jgi:hypothetical protein